MGSLFKKLNGVCIALIFAALMTAAFLTAVYCGINIPYANIILCVSFWSVAFFLFSRMKISLSGKFAAFFTAFTVSVAVWCFLSYNSYYNGVKRMVMSNAKDMYYNVKTALALDLPENEKNKIIKQYISDRNGRREQISLYKNGELIHEVKFQEGVTDNYIPERIYITEKNGESVPFYPIKVGNDTYEFSYEYANKPYLYLGILRAVTFSAFDKKSNDRYITGRNYERSTHFVFFFIAVAIAMYQFLRKKQANNELTIKNQKLDEALHKLEKKSDEQAATLLELTNFKLTYDKIQHDFKREVIDSQNFLQPMQSSWDKERKMATQSARHDVLNEIENLRAAGLPKANDFSKYQERLSMYKNKIAELSENNFDIVACTYDFLIAPWIVTIRTSLRRLDEILDITRDTYNTAEVIESLTSAKAIPKAVLEGNANSVINIDVADNINNEARLNIVMSKLESIVFNLISNSTQAVSNYKQKLRKEKSELRKTYKGAVSLKIYQVERGENNYLCIEISDNAGGFPEEILKDIYKKPVPSGKEAGRTGEGTSYIGYFVKLMNGEIEADNILLSNGSKGARTRVYIICEG